MNEGWWSSPYSSPPLIPLRFTEPGTIPALDPTRALLFCYFNNMEYFAEYMDKYEGKCVILIGPVDGSRHCAPEPYFLRDQAVKEDRDSLNGWTLRAVHAIRDTGQDHVAVYVKR